MSKLTDSEGEYWPADDEWSRAKKPAAASTAPASSNMDRINSFLDAEFDDDGEGSGFFFSDDEDADVIKSKNLKVQRDLAEGQNLNNSFGCYSPEDWEHLHVDKGANPQFKVLQPGHVPAGQSKQQQKVQLPLAATNDSNDQGTSASGAIRVQRNNFV